MTQTKIALAVGLGLVALLVAAPLANAKTAKGPLPDLVVGKVSKPPASVAGSKLNLVVKLRNKGAAKAGKSKLAVYLAKGKKHKAKDLRLKRAKVKALRPGKSAKAKLKVVLPASSAAGTYRLIACADDGKRVPESKEGDNCGASKAFKVTSPPPPPVPTSAAAAFTMTNGLDWAFNEDANRNTPQPGEPITTTLRAANGIAGQAGYVRSNAAPAALVAGATVDLDYVSSDTEDDGGVTVDLPFAFPFGGISERSVSVSTNGWVSFGGSPALDYWEDEQVRDYRGVNAVLGAFARGIMPYWSDLDVADQGAGTGTVKKVVPADGSLVAFQWDIGQHRAGGSPRRLFQLVLFPDGRFRLDYPGENAPGGEKSFIGYSLGTGAASVDAVAVGGDSVPSSSLLFTPNPVKAGTALAAGEATMTLPAGSSFVSGEAGCALSTAPSPFGEGLVSCAIPSLAPGEQATRAITFSTPADAPGETDPANFRYLGRYTSSGLTLTDDDEVDLLNASLRSVSIALTSSYVSIAPKVGMQAQFAAHVQATGSGLDQPSATFTLPANTTLNSIQISGQDIPCGAPSAGQVTCRLPSGTNDTEPVVTVTPSFAALGSTMTLGVSAQALNAAPATSSATSPVVSP
ncbi:MAG TPA: CARDB domain-containing protein [Solirubrobacterales bacterium]|nr:CARDB domain-containing protein [Solirubrobacterales bacterium]